jgi:trypsin
MAQRIRRLVAGLLVLVGGVCGFLPTAWAIEAGVDIAADQVAATGAVQYLGAKQCSGMLVTPWWVLTAAHCQVNTSGMVVLGNSADTNAPSARIASVNVHPRFNPARVNNGYDAVLIKLATPLFPRYPDGRLWDNFQRDLYRDNVYALADQRADIYGYGLTHDSSDNAPNDAGILRFGRFIIESVNPTHLNVDGYDGEQAWQGDSGSAVLVPGHDGPEIGAPYRIAGVVSQMGDRFGGDTETDASHAASLVQWFDSVLGADLTAFNAPAQMMTVLGMLY